MLTRAFWLGDRGVLVRAIRTAAQTAIAAIGVGTTNLFSADLKNVLALSASAAVLSILMSLDRSTETETAVNIVYEPQPAAIPTPAPVAEVADQAAPTEPQPATNLRGAFGFLAPTDGDGAGHGCGESLR